ncbi:MAG: hypothetical protein J5698_01420 [Bacteroidaceae bacterium]|nr:hypothetical protein [Bacteroidaceae bacterium]
MEKENRFFLGEKRIILSTSRRMKKEKTFFPSRNFFFWKKENAPEPRKRERLAWEKAAKKNTCLRLTQHSIIYLKGENLHFFRVL